MGNCLRRSRSAVWAAAEEEPQPHSPSSDPKTERHAAPQASTSALRDYGNESVSESLSGSGGTEVKIKMTKKQLNELFAKVEQQGVPVEQALAQMLETGVGYEGGDEGGVGESEMRRQQSWRPKLQSIPEVDQLK
uniref:Uncharacterized protein n=1 Tax=Kalanchoe fedtschenkoi TaxID=63787 RepID=A0A7N0RF77_KALFE